MKKLFLLLSLILLSFASCTFSEEAEENTEKESYPDLVIENASYSIGQKGQEPIDVISRKIAFYSKDDRAVIDDFEFIQRDADGDISIEGRADHCLLNTNTNEMNLEGNIILRQVKNEMEISAETLIFNPGAEEISADGFVMVKSTSGAFSGTGFHADLIAQSYLFDTLEEGELTL